MEERQKIKLTDQMQKALTQQCYKSCKSIHNHGCYQTCYDKFIRTAAAVNQALKQVAYQKHSPIAYKAYPQPSIESTYYYDSFLLPNLPGRAPVAFNRDYAA